MILKLDTKDGVRSWNLFLDDRDMYELLCDVIAFRLWRTTGKDKDWIEYHTVKVVHESGTGAADVLEKLKELNNPFLRMMLLEINRLQISLGDEIKKQKGQTDEDDTTDEG